jgi:hypothetical protein
MVSILTLLLWGFVGSLATGLRTPATAEARLAVLWLAGALLIAAIGPTIGLLTETRLRE